MLCHKKNCMEKQCLCNKRLKFTNTNIDKALDVADYPLLAPEFRLS